MPTMNYAPWVEYLGTAWEPRLTPPQVSDLRALARHLAREVADPAELAGALVRGGRAHAARLVDGWREAMMGAGLAPATINRRLATVRAILTSAWRQGAIEWRIEVKGVRAGGVRDMRGPSIDEARALLAAAVSPRDRALASLALVMGLRRSEVCRMRRAHVDLVHRTLVTRRKGRLVPESIRFPGELVPPLSAWLDVHPGGEWLFPGSGHERQPLTGEGMRAILASLGRRAGLKCRVNPHAMRHFSVSAKARASGGNWIQVSREQGITPAMVERYCDGEREPELAAAVAREVLE